MIKLLETLERVFDKLNPGLMTEEHKLMELSGARAATAICIWNKLEQRKRRGKRKTKHRNRFY